jgi:uncharacterized protein YbaP (TraB family)
MHLLRRALAPLLALLLATPVTAAPALWKFGDADTTIYLFGTIHALPPHYEWKDARLSKAMASADTLVIETLIDKDPAALAKLFPPPDPGLPPIIERVPPKDRAAFAAQLRKSGISQAWLDHMPTWQATFVLMGAMMKDLGIQRDSGVENSITPGFEPPAAGAPLPEGAKPKKIEALETPASQLALFADLSEADQRELLVSMVTGHGNAREDYARMLRAWARGDETAIAKTFADDQDLTPHLREVLLRRRNANWTQWLKARLDTPGVVFVAVGAGHLAGPMSVQHMLEQQGIRVERIWNGPRPTRNRRNQGRSARR